MDPYLALIGGTPTDAETQQALAQRLRRDRDFGMLGAITGDPALSGVGKVLMQQSPEQATQLGSNRMAQNRQDMTERYQNAQMQQMAERMGLDKARMALDQEKFGALEEYRSAQLANELEKERIKASGKADKPSKYLRGSDIKDLAALGNTAKELTSIQERLTDPEFHPGGMAIPGVRTATNFAAQYGIGTQDTKEVAAFWRDLNRFYTLAERNRLFGATLTPGESAAWKAANAGEEMDKGQLQSALTKLSGAYNEWLDNKVRGYEAEGYSRQAMRAHAGLPEEDVEDDTEGMQGQRQEAPATAPVAKPSTIQGFKVLGVK